MSARRVVLASSNPGKLRELRQMTAALGFELLPQSEFGVPEAAETGLSFVENAILKARQAARYSGLPAIADDSGILVEVLDDAPGIYSARYAGAGATDADNLALLIERVRACGVQRPAARFQCAMVYLRSAQDATPLIAEGTWHGTIVTEPRGENGFGYDPVFYLPGHACTSAQLPSEEKNRISHRGLAMRGLLHQLAEIIDADTRGNSAGTG